MYIVHWYKVLKKSFLNKSSNPPALALLAEGNLKIFIKNICPSPALYRWLKKCDFYVFPNLYSS